MIFLLYRTAFFCALIVAICYEVINPSQTLAPDVNVTNLAEDLNGTEIPMLNSTEQAAFLALLSFPIEGKSRP